MFGASFGLISSPSLGWYEFKLHLSSFLNVHTQMAQKVKPNAKNIEYKEQFNSHFLVLT